MKPSEWMKQVRHDVGRLIWRSSTEPTSLFLAFAAFCFAALLAWPGDSLANPIYKYMSDLMPEWGWALSYLVYGAAKAWRVLDRVRRPAMALVINIAGLMLVSMPTVCLMLTVRPLLVGPAFLIASTAAAFWVLLRTAINDDRSFNRE